MRIVLVHPAGSNWVPGKKDVTGAVNRMPPIGILSIASYIESKSNHKVFIHDCIGPKAPVSIEKNTKIILDFKPDIIGFSTTTSSFMDAYQMTLIIKENNPNIKIIFGGVHVSAIGEELLKEFPYIDYLGMGEGEETLLELMEGVSLNQITGLIYKDGDKIIKNPIRTPIANLDDLPFPAYEKLLGFPKKYNLPLFNYVLFPGATMITSRGCPYQCSFCDRSVFNRGFRYNSAQYIYEHMKYLKKYFGVRHINIYDDLFTANRKRIADLCKLLIDKPLGIQFNCAVRVGHTDDELLKMLKQAGLLMVSLGIESGDPKMLERHKAGVTLKQVRDTVELVQKHNIRVKGLFMMGLPGETEESVIKTSDFILSLGLDEMNLSKFTPFYGAPLWKTINQDGDFVNDWKLMNCLNFVFVPKDIESKERMDYLYNKHIKRFYTSKDWRKKFRKNLWQHRWSLLHILLNLPTFLSAKKQLEN